MSLAGKPDWLRVRFPSGENYLRLKQLMREFDLFTVCEEALCPNIAECWGGGTATIMLMGGVCTRSCRFCNVQHGKPDGRLDEFEPVKVAKALAKLGLKYVVLTSVDRDDLPDGGASHFAKTVREIKKADSRILIEVLIPDFQGDLEALTEIVSTQPAAIAHNVETTESLTPEVRDPRATYMQSLSVLANVKKLDSKVYTKSSIMLGLGEEEEEVVKTMRDLINSHVDILTLGQYLRPSKRHLPVQEYVPPERFERYRKIAEDLGFLYVASGPLVRSSYRAGELFIESLSKSLSEKYLTRVSS